MTGSKGLEDLMDGALGAARAEAAAKAPVYRRTVAPIVERVIVGAGEWHCPRCKFRRTYGTNKGAARGAAEHLLHAHGIRGVLS